LIPFIWSTASVWVVWHTHPTPAQRRFRIFAAVVVAAYLLVLFYLSGLLQSSTPLMEQITGPNGIGITWGRSLGWSPVLMYTGEWIALTIVPYQAIGLAALAYLVYDALLELARSTIGGVIGAAACPACVGPVLARCSQAVPAVPRWSWQLDGTGTKSQRSYFSSRSRSSITDGVSTVSTQASGDERTGPAQVSRL